MSFLFLQIFEESLRYSGTSDSYCSFHECGGRGETDDVEVLKIDRQVMNAVRNEVRHTVTYLNALGGEKDQCQTPQVPASVFSTESYFA